MRERDPNAFWAAVFVDELVRAGVREVCLAPGSRSTPLVLACASHPDLHVHTHIDERSAGFFALGLGRATGRPAAVLTTSGTAAANLFPAVVEAAQSEVPLLLLTADRPPELRGADANQAIDQVRLYGGYPRMFAEVGPPRSDPAALRHLRVLADRAVARALGSPAGPVHVNVPFAKPLEPALEGREATAVLEEVRAAARDEGARQADGGAAEEARGAVGRRPGHADWAPTPTGADPAQGQAQPPRTRIHRRTPGASPEAVDILAEAVRSAERAVIVCGPVPDPERIGPAVLALARACGHPLLADPLSGARWGAGAPGVALGAYDLFLRDPGVRRRLVPDLVLRIGASPTSSNVNAWLEAHADARQVVLDGGGRWKDYQALASDYLEADPGEVCRAAAEVLAGATDPAWTSVWRTLEERTWEVVAREAEPFFEGAALAAVARSVPAGGALFVSNSMPIRDLDAFVAPREAPLRVFANRGASGIDGIVSTALGVAAGLAAGASAGASPAPAKADRAAPGPSPKLVAVLGDLAFYHDMNGLLAARRPGVEAVLVVIDNDGGGIFNMLPVRRLEPYFTKHFATPHGLDFEKAAALYELPFERVPGPDLGAAVAGALETPGTRILEVRTDRESNRERHEAVAAAVAEAAREVLDSVGDDLPGMAAEAGDGAAVE